MSKDFPVPAMISSSNTSRPVMWTPALLLLILAPQAHAHVEHGTAQGFDTGFLHPWSGWDHIVAMIAVGLWGAQLGAPAVWLLPVAFPMVMAMGGFLGLMGIHVPGVELGIGLSAVLLGACVAIAVRPPLWMAALLAGIFGLFHGHAHGTELPPGQNGMLYSLGFVIATGCLHGVGIAFGFVHQWPAGRVVLRMTGGVIAVLGLMFTARALA